MVEASRAAEDLRRRMQIAVYGTTILMGAFLLFQVQLVMGKFILPRFGGDPSVWSTSLLAFQIFLLVGYGYATLLCARFSPRLQGRMHLCVLAASAATIGVLTVLWGSPILPAWAGGLHGGANPVWEIALLLTIAVGLPSVLLSSTSPLLQRWWSSSGTSPYRLYALSNLGSMLGLLTYPLLVERLLTLSSQAWVWAMGYAAFLFAATVCAVWQMRSGEKPIRSVVRKAKKVFNPKPRLLWLGLAACASTMLLATTNLICQNVAVVPLLWVIPLSLYLLSFIICFDHARWYRREIFHPLYLVLALLSLRTMPGNEDPGISVIQLLVIYCLTLLAVCMVCHGELARLKPEPQHLTSFYLMISLGGALGSAFVVLLAPVIFDRFWEFQIALLGCGVLLATTVIQDRGSWFYRMRYGRMVAPVAALSMVVGAFFLTSKLLAQRPHGDVIWRERNFFGVKTVYEDSRPERLLHHGRILHGLQSLDPRLTNAPTTYYRLQSGVGLLLRNYPRAQDQAGLRVGVVGMGVGTVALYGKKGDYYRFYEIDPAIAALSQGNHALFTYVQSSSADVEVVLGDARITMQEEVFHGELQRFDVLVVDAFRGDAIPVHLLTREAMGLYLEHMRGPRSVIAFHVSNSSLDLRPVIATLAGDYKLASIEVSQQGASDWVLVSPDPEMLRINGLLTFGQRVEVNRSIKEWTDDYSNLLELLN